MDNLESIVNQIATEGNRVVAHFIETKYLTGVIDYVTIFPHSLEEYVYYSKIVQTNKKIAGELPTGNYYWLDSPIVTPIGIIKRMRVQIFDARLTKRGYVDFEVKDFSDFKTKYLKQPEFSLIDKKEYKLVKFESDKSNVLVYFPYPFE